MFFLLRNLTYVKLATFDIDICQSFKLGRCLKELFAQEPYERNRMDRSTLGMRMMSESY